MKQKKEPEKELKIRTFSILKILTKAFPGAKTALHHSSALDLLISTILSAQCTDQRVNIVTKDLFNKYSTPKDYADANQTELESLIRSTGFYKAKAKNIMNCCKMLISEFNGEIPETMEELIRLPGVGRKTANVILGNYFNKAEGIVVDTHVKRLSGRIGLSKKTDPEKIEQDLMEIVPKKYWITVGNLLIQHGRKFCPARKPQCSDCPINHLCPSALLE